MIIITRHYFTHTINMHNVCPASINGMMGNQKEQSSSGCSNRLSRMFVICNCIQYTVSAQWSVHWKELLFSFGEDRFGAGSPYFHAQ